MNKEKPRAAAIVVKKGTSANSVINPFKVPDDNAVYQMRYTGKKKNKLESRKTPTDLENRITIRQAASLYTDDNEKLNDGDQRIATLDKCRENVTPVKESPEFIVGVTKDRFLQKETLSEYITKRREMFLLQYALREKRKQMQKLEEIATAEEEKIETAEKYLQEDAMMFDEFLKENDKSSLDARKIAEEESKNKQTKVIECRHLNGQLLQIKSEINKCVERLKEYKTYKDFLHRILPAEMRQEREERDKLRKQLKAEVEEKFMNPPSENGSDNYSNTESLGVEECLQWFEDDEEEENERYFKEPNQLLTIFTELEESNLSLIQNCQENEEAIEELKQTSEVTKTKMLMETQMLQEQIDKLKKAIKMEQVKINDLKLKSEMFSYGSHSNVEQKEMLDRLYKAVDEVYRSCVPDASEASQGTIQMLTLIEHRIEELFQTLEILPNDKIELAQKSKDKERRLRQRLEKKEQQRLQQEDRIKKALERSKAAPKKQLGRRVVQRSDPPQLVKHNDGANERLAREQEEFAYFFT